ncbi:MAG TPA: winged helix-turn-helix domain-containing protein [Nitrososphaerales archaeon]|nr:winged helix-turn-helix domain-containing protein [Nitrososphaerales archaeon]
MERLERLTFFASEELMNLNERRRRDSNQIKYEILMSALPGGRKTHIMYESGLNLKQLNSYLEELLMNGALEFRLQEKRYFTTEKGRAFARAFDHYRETIDQLGKQEVALAQFFPTTAKRTIVAQ